MPYYLTEKNLKREYGFKEGENYAGADLKDFELSSHEPRNNSERESHFDAVLTRRHLEEMSALEGALNDRIQETRRIIDRYYDIGKHVEGAKGLAGAALDMNPSQLPENAHAQINSRVGRNPIETYNSMRGLRLGEYQQFRGLSGGSGFGGGGGGIKFLK